MKKEKRSRQYLSFIAILSALALFGCSVSGENTSGDTTAPRVNSTVPIDTTPDVALNGTINATFNEAMKVDSIVGANFSVKVGGVAVAGTV
ncbi:MAG: Ig-like domain-containing protein, partial [Treponemataceae bacterium]